MSETDLVAEGQEIGRYRVGSLLGRGAFGVVYRAVRISDSVDVALKVLTAQSQEDLTHLLRFQREAWTASRLAHPNIVRVYEAGFTDGLHYIAMEFVDGANARESMQNSGGRMGVSQVLSIAADCLSALGEAHRRGILHRDVKPENVMLARDGTAKLSDFSLAKPINKSWTITGEGSVVGTPMFMSPEQTRGMPLDPRTDIFSLGATLYVLLTGTTPYFGPTALEVMEARWRAAPAPVRQLSPGIPGVLSDLVAEMMKREKEDRLQSAGEALAALQQVAKECKTAPRTAVIPETVRVAPIGAPRRSLPMVVCPKCLIGFRAEQAVSYVCPRSVCGNTWRPLSITGDAAMRPDRRQATPEVMLLTGRRMGVVYRIEKDVTTIGSLVDCDITVPDLKVRSHHLRLVRDGEDFAAVPTDPRDGFYLNEALCESQTPIESCDRILVGRSIIEFRLRFSAKGVDGRARREMARRMLVENPRMLRGKRPVKVVELDSDRLTLGRDPSRDITLDSSLVSRKHALIKKETDGIYVLDTKSKGGTFVNDEPVICRKLIPGDVVQIGPFVFTFDGGTLRSVFS